jgi:hypothetical protein
MVAAATAPQSVTSVLSAVRPPLSNTRGADAFCESEVE